ncbi:MAG: M48 family metalloprotease [Cyanobacteria bacterium P01_H01_bin.15]
MNDPSPKAGRSQKSTVKLALTGAAGNLALASLGTLSLLGGMLLALVLALLFIVESPSPAAGLTIAVLITIIFNLVIFFLSPFLMDLTQRWLYKTRWITLDELRRQSPEAAQTLMRVCRKKKLKIPRLGIIDDQNPTAFTYGSLPSTARLVVSQGLFTYLDDDEVATVYAHELGHIVHWDFAVMTLAATLVQIMYLVYITALRLQTRGSEKSKDAAQIAAIAAYVFYLIGTYLQLYLSRVREYYADHFAAEVTGNPNGLSRALVKIAYGVVEEGQRSPEPSRLMEGTRALGIYDHRSAATTGNAYRIASSPEKIGRVFLWDLFNPWGGWLELQSTHPLTGKRVRSLTNYAEQLGLSTEFNFAQVVRSGKQLNKQKLYGNFAVDWFAYFAPFLGILIGLLLAVILPATTSNSFLFIAYPLIGFGFGILIKTQFMFPEGSLADTTILELMSDPYASPLRGRPVSLRGDLIGRGDAGNRVGSDLKLQDKTGMIFTHYSSRFGPIGNFLFGVSQVKSLIGSEVRATGWFRRSIMPLLDLRDLKAPERTVKSYHRFWQWLCGGGAIIIGLGLMFFG